VGQGRLQQPLHGREPLIRPLGALAGAALELE
jgi:hypothetical protein